MNDTAMDRLTISQRKKSFNILFQQSKYDISVIYMPAWRVICKLNLKGYEEFGKSKGVTILPIEHYRSLMEKLLKVG